MKSTKAITQYLSQYAEPLARTIIESSQTYDWPRTQYAVVIPCFDETPEFAKRLEAHPSWQQGVTAIVVLNQPSHIQPITEQNQTLLRFFSNKPYAQPHSWGTSIACGRSLWIVVNACHELAPTSKHGVGLMRKLGADIATALWANSLVQSTWLHSTDADATLPNEYFNLPEDTAHTAALYEFTHTPSKDVDTTQATQVYEAAIRYYAKSLIWAGSPYGFVALGSTLAVRFDAYCQLRGFPKKSGGEDFYLINKAIKLGACYYATPTVQLDSRTSHRVPFGTGPATQVILELHQQGKDYPYYAPQCFRALKSWIELGLNLWGQTALPESTSEEVCLAASALGVETLITHINTHCTNPEQAKTAFHHWFDGFKTLKFVRYLQAHYYPAIDLTQCLETAVYME